MRGSFRTTGLKIIATTALLQGFHAAGQSPFGVERNFRIGSRQTIFSNVAYVRDDARPDARKIDSLPAFAEVGLWSIHAETRIHNLAAPWYKVRYTKAGAERWGYIWGGTLALRAFRHRGAIFACGLRHTTDPDATKTEDTIRDLNRFMTFSIKAHSSRGHGECRFNIDRNSFWLEEDRDSSGVLTDTHLWPLDNIVPDARAIVHFSMAGEKIGIPTYSLAAVWNGARLVCLPPIRSELEGNGWRQTETFVFPSGNEGKPGKLRIKRTTLWDAPGTDENKQAVKWLSYRYDAVKRAFVLTR